MPGHDFRNALDSLMSRLDGNGEQRYSASRALLPSSTGSASAGGGGADANSRPSVASTEGPSTFAEVAASLGDGHRDITADIFASLCKGEWVDASMKLDAMLARDGTSSSSSVTSFLFLAKFCVAVLSRSPTDALVADFHNMRRPKLSTLLGKFTLAAVSAFDQDPPDFDLLREYANSHHPDTAGAQALAKRLLEAHPDSLVHEWQRVKDALYKDIVGDIDPKTGGLRHRVEPDPPKTTEDSMLPADALRDLPDALAPLLKLSGLANVKLHIIEMVRSLHIAKHEQGAKMALAHRVLTGNPGVGKTTVARMLAEILQAIGVIPEADEDETNGGNKPPPGGAPPPNGATPEQQLQHSAKMMAYNANPGKEPLTAAEKNATEALLLRRSSDGNSNSRPPVQQRQQQQQQQQQKQQPLAQQMLQQLRNLQDNYKRSPERLDLERRLKQQIRTLDRSLLPKAKTSFVEIQCGHVVHKPLDDFIKLLHNNTSGVIFLDEFYMLKPDFLNILLTEFEEHRDTRMFVLAGYERQINDTLSKNPGFASRLPTILKFQDYTEAELRNIFLRMVKDLSSTCQLRVDNENTVNAAIARIAKTRGTPGFGNARDVRNMVEQAHARQCARLALLPRGELEKQRAILFEEDVLGSINTATHAIDKIFAEMSRTVVGATEVKRQFITIASDALRDRIREHKGNEPTSRCTRHRAFFAPAGSGKTTLAKLYGEILHAVGVCSKKEFVSTSPSELKGQVLGETAQKVNAAFDRAENAIIFIDEAYALAGAGAGSSSSQQQSSDPYCDEMVTAMLTRFSGEPTDRCIVIMAGYEPEMRRMFDSVNSGLKRRMQADDAFVLKNFTVDELGAVVGTTLRKAADESNLTIDTGVIAAAARLLEGRRNLPNFGNAGDARALAERLVTRARQSREFDVQGKKMRIMLEHVKVEDEMNNDAWDQVQKYPPVRDFFERLERRRANLAKRGITTSAAGGARHLSLQLCGAPGTGKSTGARLIGAAMKRLGMLSKGHVVERSVSNMQTGFVGQAGLKTRELLRESLGGCLFIDEAYRLVEERGFGNEIINELVNALEEDEFKGKVCVIVAGYKERMGALSLANEGFARRFPYQIDFPHFSGEQCARLFLEYCGNRSARRRSTREGDYWDLDAPSFGGAGDDDDDEAGRVAKLSDIFAFMQKQCGRLFGNAGTVQSLFDACQELESAEWTFAEIKEAAVRYCNQPQFVAVRAENENAGARSRLGHHHDDDDDDASELYQTADVRKNANPVKIGTKAAAAVSQSGNQNDDDADDDGAGGDAANQKQKECQPGAVCGGGGPSSCSVGEGLSDWLDRVNNTLQQEKFESGDKANNKNEQRQRLEAQRDKLQKQMGELAAYQQALTALTNIREEQERVKRELREAQEKAQRQAAEALQRKLDELQRQEEERQRQLEQQRRAQEEMARVQRRAAALRDIGRCPAGYAWRREGNGYRCEGGAHFVSLDQLPSDLR